jgi:poly-gamma-glutamate synthesis protein (capsule biosynthesis protein)
MKFWYLFVLAALLCSCRFDYVKIIGDGEYEPERAFLESLFEEGGGLQKLGLLLLADDTEKSRKAPQAALFIEILSSWEQDDAFGDIFISRRFMVPQEDPLTGRIDTSLEACLEGKETLVQLEEIAPPFAALRVDGLALGDDGYPLVMAVGVRLGGEDKKLNGRLSKKLQLLYKALEDAPKPLLQDMPELFWIAAGGDTMLDRGASEILFKEGPAGIFGGTAEMLASSDLTLINLEGVISSRGEKVPKSFNFRFVPEIAAALKNAGIDAALHANNHVFDYGKDAFLDSLSWMNKAGIGIAGAGIDDDAASQPFVFTKGDETFRVFGIASFPRERNGWDGVSAAAGPGQAGMLHSGRGGREKLKARISPSDASLNIILFHGGVEWSTRPDAATRELYTDLIDAGADLIIGSHPHIVQGFEWVNGKPVFWSLGNYVFGGMENTDGGEEGLFIRLGYWRGRLIYIEPYALSLTHTRTDISPREKLNVFYARSRALKVK